MWIFGDRERKVDAVAAFERARSDWSRALGLDPPIDRHGATVAAFIGLAGLLQGIADALHRDRGHDDVHPATDALTAVLLSAARSVDRSRHGRKPRDLPLDDVLRARAAVASFAAELGRSVRVREAEGFAHYAFYPEAWSDAARTLPPHPRHVIGLRSIGAALAPMAAAGTDALSVTTLRPAGPHFAREVRIGDGLRRLWTSEPEARFVIVDEGPGLSGSSFCAAIECLVGLGIDEDRISVLPNHADELGAESSERHRRLWRRIERRVVPPPRSVLSSAKPPLTLWFEDVTGPVHRVEDLSGGAWRSLLFPDGGAPASDVSQEKLKYRLTTDRGRFLLKFAGLGGFGADKVERAAALAQAGFGNPVLGFRHGFMIEPWLDGVPLEASGAPVPRDGLIEKLAAYLAFRARRFPAPAEAGASLDALVAMAEYNIGLGLGDGAAEALRAFVASRDLAGFSIRRIVTDGRLDPHEWILSTDGRLIKTDALDHASAHDLVGAQDLAWDAAGAAIAFDLGDAETGRLLRLIEREGHAVDPDLVELMVPLFLAFRFGAARLALESCPATEIRGLSEEADRHAARLTALLDAPDIALSVPAGSAEFAAE